MTTIDEIAAKYGHEMQNDANPSAQLIQYRKKAQAAIDRLYNAAMNANAALNDYNRANAASSYSANTSTFTFSDIMNAVKNGQKIKV